MLNMMDFIASCSSEHYIEKFANTSVTHLLIEDVNFSSGIKGFENSELEKVISLIHKNNMKALVRVDCLYDENQIDSVVEYLKNLDKWKADGILFSDISLKMIAETNNLKLKLIYAPETLLTSSYEMKALKADGIDNCVISKDITLKEAYDAFDNLKDYCYIRTFGPILISYGKRRFVDLYLNDNTNHLKDYYLKEETREMKLPIIEKDNGCWLYGPTLESVDTLKQLSTKPIKGILVDSIIYDDEYILKVCDLYSKLLKNEIDEKAASEVLSFLGAKYEFTKLSDIKQTILKESK